MAGSRYTVDEAYSEVLAAFDRVTEGMGESDVREVLDQVASLVDLRTAALDEGGEDEEGGVDGETLERHIRESFGSTPPIIPNPRGAGA